MKLNINESIIDKTLNEYYTRNYVSNIIYFNVKSINIFYFHKFRLLYGLPTHLLIKNHGQIKYKVMITIIQKL